ncbi:MAG TPA: class F sortase [bacterium]|nr:class F sortase [bacterium]
MAKKFSKKQFRRLVRITILLYFIVGMEAAVIYSKYNKNDANIVSASKPFYSQDLLAANVLGLSSRHGKDVVVEDLDVDSETSSTNPVSANSTEQEISTSSVFESILGSITSTPSRLEISSQGINIPLVQVGVSSSGSMETPVDWNSGGWYSRSAKLGAFGNTIINAHYDNNFGAPAAFWRLQNVAVGDTVGVFDELGRRFDYVVSETFYVDIQDPERLKIFDEPSAGKSELTLVTCGGVWVPSEGTYNKRLVVKAEYVGFSFVD